MSSTLITAVLVGALVVGPAPDPSAEALTQQAQDAARAGDVEGAVALFERGRALDGRATWNCNIAVVYYRADEHVLAMHFFDRCLARADELDAQTRAGVEQGRAFVREQLVTAGHAEIKFDLRPLEAHLDLAPYAPGRLDRDAPVWLAAGRHQAQFTAPGYVSVQREIVVETGRAQTIVVELSQEPNGPVHPTDPTPAPTLDPTASETSPTHDLVLETPVDRSRRNAWVGAGLGYGLLAAGLGVGVGMHAVALSTRRELADTPEGPARDALISGAYTVQRGVALAGYGLGLVGAGLGVGMTVRAVRAKRPSAASAQTIRLAPWLSTEGGGLRVGWQL